MQTFSALRLYNNSNNNVSFSELVDQMSLSHCRLWSGPLLDNNNNNNNFFLGGRFGTILLSAGLSGLRQLRLLEIVCRSHRQVGMGVVVDMLTRPVGVLSLQKWCRDALLHCLDSNNEKEFDECVRFVLFSFLNLTLLLLLFYSYELESTFVRLESSQCLESAFALTALILEVNKYINK